MSGNPSPPAGIFPLKRFPGTHGSKRWDGLNSNGSWAHRWCQRQKNMFSRHTMPAKPSVRQERNPMVIAYDYEKLAYELYRQSDDLIEDLISIR